MSKGRKITREKAIVLNQGKKTKKIGLKSENACLMCGINNPDNR